MASLVADMLGAPSTRMLGRPVAAPVLSVFADRSLARGLATVGWDDEGVAPDAFGVIEQGVLVDRATTRSSARELAAWYAQRGATLRSHGCAVAGGMATPRVALPNLRVEPARAEAGVAELIADVRRGVYLSEDGGGGTDDGAGTGQWSASSAQEIRNGRLVGYVRDVAIQFRVQEFWHALDAIGGSRSVERVPAGGATVQAVPGRFRTVDVVSTEAIA
jgi:TldD protein